jgi:hypothetical protein
MNCELLIEIEEMNGLEREKQGLPTSSDLVRKVDMEKHYLRMEYLCSYHMLSQKKIFYESFKKPVPNYLIPSDHLNECDRCSDIIYRERMIRDAEYEEDEYR